MLHPTEESNAGKHENYMQGKNEKQKQKSSI